METAAKLSSIHRPISTHPLARLSDTIDAHFSKTPRLYESRSSCELKMQAAQSRPRPRGEIRHGVGVAGLVVQLAFSLHYTDAIKNIVTLNAIQRRVITRSRLRDARYNKCTFKYIRSRYTSFAHFGRNNRRSGGLRVLKRTLVTLHAVVGTDNM